jgi:type I restriction enzyme R subunit
MVLPEQAARAHIDALLEAAGWVVQDFAALNLSAGRGIAVREFALDRGYGFADYLLYVDGHAVGVVEAKPEGATLTGVEPQAARYAEGLPDHLPAPVRPLPFLYQSTGTETRFTNGLDPDPRSRQVFHFHQPGTLARWLEAEPVFLPLSGGRPDPRSERPSTLRSRIQTLPDLDTTGLWPVQARAVRNLELSLRQNKPRALIQMATGAGKTFTAVTSTYRLIKFADASRVLFLVDRDNLGRQAEKEFQQYTTPDDGRKFTELYNVQRLRSNRLDPVARVVITTIQRLYSMLKGAPDFDASLEQGSQFDTLGGLVRQPVPVTYSPALPIETFDVLFIDECHRSIYSLWRQVLEYFDAFLIGLTATPSKQTLGFFNKNLVMEYGHADAVVDGVNVDYDVYRIRTRITQQGSTVEAGPEEVVGRRDRATRAMRWETLDEDLTYDSDALDRQVVAPDQIRTIIRAFRDKLFTEVFPGRTHVPKTLIFAKDDSHADDIVQIVREEFGKGNDFCQKITYRTSDPETVLSDFRTRYFPRIAVTVDMIATGTDVKPLEIVMFMRAIRSRNFFEQMKGRGVRVIDTTDLQSVTPDAAGKDRFVLIDCLGLLEHGFSDTVSLERKPGVSLQKILNAVAGGTTDPDILSSLAGRLARIDHRISQADREALATVAGGRSLSEIARGLVEALDPDHRVEEARRINHLPADVQPTHTQLAEAERALLGDAAAPLATNPELRSRILEIQRALEQTIDVSSQDKLLDSRFAPEIKERHAERVVRDFEQFIAKHRDEITALQVLYSRPYHRRVNHDEIKALAEAIQAPPQRWTPEYLWRAYEALHRDKVRGAGAERLMTDLVSLVRFALHHDGELVPYGDRVRERFQAWLLQQQNQGKRFTDEQRQWLEAIRDHVAANAEVEINDLGYAPFAQMGGVGKAVRVFGGDGLVRLLDELNEALAA